MKISNIYQLQNVKLNNKIFIKREDLIPFSFGGNKARKAYYFFKEIEEKKFNYVITYGSASSNHCRVIANLCKQRDMKCTIITTEVGKEDFNRKMCEIFNAEIIICSVDNVKKTIEQQINKKRIEGYNPYFIQGGGHGNIGTKAYVETYEEIKLFEQENNIKFDYIFHASGTGTTQAGLVIGNKLNDSSTKIIGISIARKLPYGRDVILNSIEDYKKQYNLNLNNIEKEVIFIDDYVLDGYGTSNKEIEDVIIDCLNNEGIPLDTTYTGKAFWGMKQYIEKEKLKNKNILFIHTGGIPIFFDFLRRKNK